ncbi:MAG: ATP-binding protein [Gemmatimonadota bacterium]
MTRRRESVVLLVEDDLAVATRLSQQLASLDRSVFGNGVSVLHFRTVTEATAAGALDPVLVLLDLSLPDAVGLQALVRLRSIFSAPIIVTSSVADPRLAARVLKAGAQDFLVKPQLDKVNIGLVVAMAVERHRLDREQRTLVSEAQRSALAREHLVRVVSHDLQNPLNTLKLCASALRARSGNSDGDGTRKSVRRSVVPGETVDDEGATDHAMPTSPRAPDVVDVIEQSVEWMQQLTTDLLDRTSLDAGMLVLRREWISVDALLQRVATMFEGTAREHGISLHVERAGALPDIHADPRRLRQVLSNLVGNAIAYTPRGGRVSLSASLAVRASSDAAGVARRGVRFTVTDTGPGISVDELARLFDWSWRVPRRGHAGWGIGLAIAKGLVEVHGSALHVSSIEGEGTTFSFVIAPRARPRVAEHAPLSLPEPA